VDWVDDEEATGETLEAQDLKIWLFQKQHHWFCLDEEYCKLMLCYGWPNNINEQVFVKY